MKATFFIIPESFQYDGASRTDTEKKIENFALDLRKIKETFGNEIFCHSEVYNVDFFENNTISDFLNNPKIDFFDRDISQQLRIIWELE